MEGVYSIDQKTFIYWRLQHMFMHYNINMFPSLMKMAVCYKKHTVHKVVEYTVWSTVIKKTGYQHNTCLKKSFKQALRKLGA